jgi:Tol biopolymer transport system component
MFVYYDDNHAIIDAQIRYGIAEIILNQWLYGGNWRDRIRSSNVMNLPDWYTKGLLNYIAYGWNEKVDNKVRDAFANKRFKHLNNLNNEDAILAGHSIWNFIVENYGTEVIPNLIYMSQMSRNIESGFMFVFGISGKNFLQSWQNYYQDLYQSKKNNSKAIAPTYTKIKGIKRFKKNENLTCFKISPDGNYYAYAVNYLGRYKVYLYDVNKKKRKLISKGGLKLERTNDYSFPILTWHPSSQRFAIITEDKGEVVLSYYLLDMKALEKRPPLFYFDKVLDFDYMPDGKRFLMSAVKNNQSDIFIYNIVSNKIDNITNDIYDDRYPIALNKGKTLVFSSNRANDTIITKTPYARDFSKLDYDLYAYNVISKPVALNRLTSSKNTNEVQLVKLDSNSFYYLSDKLGRNNRFIGQIDSSIIGVDTIIHYKYYIKSKQITNFSNSILGHNFSSNAKVYADWFIDNRRMKISVNNIPDQFPPISDLTKSTISSKQNTDSITLSQSNIQTKNLIQTIRRPISPSPVSPGAIDFHNYIFEGEVNNTTAATPKENQTNNSKSTVNTVSSEFKLPKQLNYFKFFTTDQILSQFNNNFSSNSYQKYTGGEFYYTPSLNGMFKVGLSDLFEDYRLVGGFRLSLDMKSNEFMLSVEDRHKRWDKQIILYRQSIPQTLAAGPKVLSHTLTYSLKYPFSEVFCFKTNLAMRTDRSSYLATDDKYLAKKSTQDFWALTKAELVYDNTRSPMTNILNGFRAKLFAEYYNNVIQYKQNLGVVGLDMRYYQKIYKNIIWATRVAYSTSFGTKRLAYYLGAVDNWWNINSAKNPTFNNSTTIKNDSIYAFQAIATNMRGFQQNIRNGNNFALVNSEIRVPIFNTILKKNVSSEFINNFQFIYFLDAGSAWVGLTPYSNSDENIQVKPTIKKKSDQVVVSLVGTKNPFVYGYGWGLRSKVLGYFVRVDFANGVEQGAENKKMVYLSLSTDF